MKKENLIEMGLTEEQADKVIRSIESSYIEKARFDELSEENKSLKKSVSGYDKQLEDLKKSSGDNEALQQQIADLQNANAEQKKTHEAEMAKLRLDNAVELALSGAKAKNNKAVKALLDMSKVKLDESGKLTGFDEQVEALKKSDEYMFDVKQQSVPQFRGFQPGVSSVVPDSAAAGYETRLAEARKNNNQLEVIKIKQEAAGAGVVLM